MGSDQSKESEQSGTAGVDYARMKKPGERGTNYVYKCDCTHDGKTCIEEGTEPVHLDGEKKSVCKYHLKNKKKLKAKVVKRATPPAPKTRKKRKTGRSAAAKHLQRTVMGTKSDIRLKQDILRTGTSASGIPVYRFRYRDDPGTEYQGVMAQDLLGLGRGDAVFEDKCTGMYMVDYSLIDVNCEQIKFL